MLLLPLLIGGYLFNLIFYPFRYFSSRAEGQKLFFMSAGSGLFLGVAVFLCAPIASSLLGTAAEPIHSYIASAIPIPHATKVLAVLALAILLGLACNGLAWLLFLRRSKPTSKCVHEWLTQRFGNPLDQLFWLAAESQKLVLINLKSRKVYCGRVIEVPGNLDADGAFIELLPSFSGYRDKDTLSFGSHKTEYPVITLWEVKQYIYSLREKLAIVDRHLREFRSEAAHRFLAAKREGLEIELAAAQSEIEGVKEPPNFDPADWIKVFPVAEIESASIYDSDAYDVWFRGSDPPAGSDDGSQALDAADESDSGDEQPPGEV